MMTSRVFGLCILPLFLPALSSAQTPPTEGLRSYLKAREVLDAGATALGGWDALRATKTIRRQLSSKWIGSGQHPRPYHASTPTLTVPPPNGCSDIMSFIDYGESRWLDVDVDLSSPDAVTRVSAITEGGGYETLVYRDEKLYFPVVK